MKRIISMLICITSLCGICNTSFAKVGDIKGYATYTDICTYINNYPITSYNLNGYTVVVAEDLRNYGFYVDWDRSSRSLKIKRSGAKIITPYGNIYKYASKLGQKSSPFLETDIKTYINGAEVQGYNIDGKTVISVADLRSCAEVEWHPSERVVKIWISGLPRTQYVQLEDISSTIANANESNYNKLKNIIDEKGDSRGNDHLIHHSGNGYSVIFGYIDGHKGISLYFHYKENPEQTVMIIIYPDKNPNLSFTEKNGNYEYTISADFPKANKEYVERENTFPTLAKNYANKVLNLNMEFMDSIMSEMTGMSFADFGLYYVRQM